MEPAIFVGIRMLVLWGLQDTGEPICSTVQDTDEPICSSVQDTGEHIHTHNKKERYVAFSSVTFVQSASFSSIPLCLPVCLSLSLPLSLSLCHLSYFPLRVQFLLVTAVQPIGLLR